MRRGLDAKALRASLVACRGQGAAVAFGASGPARVRCPLLANYLFFMCRSQQGTARSRTSTQMYTQDYDSHSHDSISFRNRSYEDARRARPPSVESARSQSQTRQALRLGHHGTTRRPSKALQKEARAAPTVHATRTAAQVVNPLSL